MSSYQGQSIPPRIYYGVPGGWHADEIVLEHARLGGDFALATPAPVEIRSPHRLPEQEGWLHYRQTVHRLADGVRGGDAACVELAIRYIELRHIGSYAGYLRERLARALKHAPLDEAQRRRLHGHFATLCLRGEHTHEFGEYVRLWRRIASAGERTAVVAALGELPGGESRAARLAAWLGAPPGEPASG